MVLEHVPIVSVSPEGRTAPGSSVKVPHHVPPRVWGGVGFPTASWAGGGSWGPRAGRAGKDLESRRNLEKAPCSCWSLPAGPPAPRNVLGVEAPQEAPPPGAPRVQHRQDPV